MKGCPTPHCGGRIWDDGFGLLCNLCSRVVKEHAKTLGLTTYSTLQHTGTGGGYGDRGRHFKNGEQDEEAWKR
jgi:hypothetical protein